MAKFIFQSYLYLDIRTVTFDLFNSFKMRNIIILFIYIFLVSSNSSAQVKKFTRFSDFMPVCRNTDSLEKAISKQLIVSKENINNLIWLEMTYRDRNIKFGHNIEKIGKESKSQKYELGTAMYYYLKHIQYFEKNRSLSLENLTKAHQYFLLHKDISGLLRTYFSLARINVNTDAFIMGDRKEYLQNAQLLFETGKKATLTIDKLFLDLRRLQMSRNLQMKINIEYYEHLITIKEYEHPDNNLIMGSIIYELGRYYGEKGDSERALTFMIKSVEKQAPFLDDYSLRNIYYSIAINFYLLKKFKESEEYILRVLDMYHKNPHLSDDAKEGCYDLYTLVLFKEKQLEKAWFIRNIYDSLANIRRQTLGMDKLLDLQKKYTLEKRELQIVLLEFEKKVAESKNAEYKSTIRNKELQSIKIKEEFEKKELKIKALALEKEITTSRIRNYIWGVVLLISSLLVLFLLLLKLRKTNRNLLELQKEKYRLDTIIAHDLRSPFNTYQRYSEIIAYLIKTKQFSRLQETAKHIEFTGSKIALLLDNLLNWSTSMQQNNQGNITKIHLKPFFNDLLPLYYDMADFKQINLTVTIQDSEIVTDKNILSVVLRNLLDNAIKYTDKEHDISLDVRFINDELLLSIKNYCSEITDYQKNQIVNFLINTKIQPFDGIGIGLILIKQYSQKMKASLSFAYETQYVLFELKIPL